MRKILVQNFIRELRDSFGLKSPVDEKELFGHYQAKDYHGMAGVIMKALAVDLKVNLGLVNKGGPNAPAWLKRPNLLPPIFSPQFKKTEVTIYLRKTFISNVGFETVVLALAHEFSHIVLDSTHHKLRRHEEAVDLTAMLLGFRDYYVTGSATHLANGVYRIGYLTEEEISYAAWFMTFGE